MRVIRSAHTSDIVEISLFDLIKLLIGKTLKGPAMEVKVKDVK